MKEDSRPSKVWAALAAPRMSLRDALAAGQRRVESAISRVGEEDALTPLDALGPLAKLKLLQLEVVHAGLEGAKALAAGERSLTVQSEADFGRLPFRELTLREFLRFGRTVSRGEQRTAELSKRLEGLRLRGATLTPADADALAAEPLMEQLSLDELDVTDALAKRLSALVQLRILDLSGNPQLTDLGIKHLQTLSRLELLNLEATAAADGCGRAIARLPHLRWLSLADTGIRDQGIAALSELSRLETLNLAGTGVTNASLRGIGALPRLKRLSLAGTAIDDRGVAALVRSRSHAYVPVAATTLTRLGCDELDRLARLPLPGGRLLERAVTVGRSLAARSALEMLDLSRTGITDAALELLEPLQGLHWLNLEGTRVSDDGLQHLRGLRGLRTVNVAGTHVTNAGTERLREALPACEVLVEG